MSNLELGVLNVKMKVEYESLYVKHCICVSARDPIIPLIVGFVMRGSKFVYCR